MCIINYYSITHLLNNSNSLIDTLLFKFIVKT